MKTKFATILPVLLAAVFLGGCSASVEPDSRPAMPFDPVKPYRLEFGRGDARMGLDTVAVNESGQAVLCRHVMEQDEKEGWQSHWETATLQLQPGAVRRLAEAVHDLGLTKMALAYYADISDGTQWIFWLEQGGQEKVVYFDNHFPKAIRHFAERLDAELGKAGGDKASWSRVPDSQARSHDQALWDRLYDAASQQP